VPGQRRSTFNYQTTLLGDERAEDETGDRGKLHQNIDGRATRVLKRVTYGVANDGRLVLISALAVRALLFEHKFIQLSILLLELVRATLIRAFLNQFLTVIPSSAGVRE